ncbi:MAG: ABC transporter permease [Acidobacteria bacterium]|nr:ABC transporter permease [Acidobacteriota bacterium]
MSALNRKLLRDLIAMRTQALAIALVIAAGIAMFVAYLSNFDSLERARDDYYRTQRFAEVFAYVRRAPDQLDARIRAIAGVEDVETRVVAEVVLDVPGLDEPATGRLVSVPADERPRLNDLFLRRGTWITPGRSDEVLVSEAFADAHGFRPGDRVGAVINGRRRDLVMVGVVLSPEYVYGIKPGELVPDAKRYGIFWMGHEALSTAFEMDGAFNDVVLSLAQGAVPEAVVADLDRVLEPYGGRGATLRALQPSNWMLNSELGQLQSFGFFVPLIFLFVAAFVLNIALTRALALQRPQLASLKALGYTNRELVWHYLKWALVIAIVGAMVGVAAGVWMGTAMLNLYREYFTFPVLRFHLTGGVVLQAAAIAVVSALVGAYRAVHRAVGIQPAEAMLPETPTTYRHSAIERMMLGSWLSVTSRMLARNLQRQPVRALTTVVGIGMAGAILQVGFGMVQSVDALIHNEFNVAERQNMTVTFVEPLAPDARHALSRLPGVLQVEPQRSVAARIRSGHVHRTLAITGLLAVPDLKRPIDQRQRAVQPHGQGVVLSAILAEVLGVVPGDEVTIEVLEGQQPVRRVVVEGTVDDVLGTSAFMEMATLQRLLREDATLSGAALMIDTAREAELTAALKNVPAVAGVASKRVMLENFREMMDENMGVMLTFNILFAGVIAFGVVYNAARVSLSERSRELASLRVLGFTRAEISAILLGELALLTLCALPFGALFGYWLTSLLVGSIESEMFRFPAVFDIQAMATASLTVIVASMVSGLLVRRRLDHLDLVGVLKLRE